MDCGIKTERVSETGISVADEGASTGWEALLVGGLVVAGGEAVLLLLEGGDGWRKAMLHPAADPLFRGATLDGLTMAALAVGRDGMFAGQGTAPLWVQRFPGMAEAAMVVRGGTGWNGPGPEAARTLGLLAEIPGLRRLAEPGRRLGGRIENMALVLDLVVLVNSVDGFREALLKVVNEVAARCGCQRVALGWLYGGFCRVRAVSHADQVDRKSGLIALLEAAMDECADQDVEIVLPAGEDDDAARRDHDALQAETKSQGIASLPLRADGKGVGVLTLEREGIWTREELAALRLTADLLGPVLAGMERRSRWLGARAWHGLRENAAKLLGHQHTGWKLLGLGVVVAVVVLFSCGMTYRVEATFIVETDGVAMVTAPFDGFLDEVAVRVGDDVAKGAALFSLDTKELSLQEAQMAAEWRHQTATALKAEGDGKLPDLRIAEASAAQSLAKLELVRFRLSQALVKAPCHGVVIEGDLREKLGAPVRQGEVMVKLVQLDELFLEIQIDERDIDELTADASGEIAFTADPSQRLACRIERIEPATQTRQAGNVFVARALAVDGVQAWWRPGMGGVAKINVGRRSFWWLLTHRTTDFLRMKLWW
ncbi:MAG: efflux RND transporter periplasmic adaptor subunit [Verrucomicrobia bacterium]|nr:efflux RND transporter periplasmic adaptor subunit [Verrucomicrobiota bacterium]